MKILVIANTNGSLIFLNQYCDMLTSHSIELDVLDIWNFKFIKWSNLKKEEKITHIKWLVNLFKLKHFFRSYFNNCFIKSLAKYDIVILHYASPQRFLPIIKNLRKKSRIITLTIWGSDFYRRNKKKDHRYIKLLNRVDIIYTPAYGLNKDFISDFPSVINKVRITLLGIGYLEIIKSLKDKAKQSDKKIEFNKSKNGILITCGYNSNSAQQHLIMIEAIKRIKNNIPKNVLFVFPLTYYSDKEGYLEMVKDELDKCGINYLIRDRLMNEQEVATLRLETDLAVNIQKTDAFSHSIREHLYAGNVVLVGDWLPYDYLEQRGVFYLKTSLNDLAENMAYCINNIEELKNKCLENPEIIYSFSSWNNVIQDWVKSFQVLLDGKIGTN